MNGAGQVDGAEALDAFALTDVGTERGHDEDACGVRREPGGALLAAVADGVSGGPAGELASRLAIEVLERAFAEGPALPAGERLHRAVHQANLAVHEKAVAVPELRGMATTLTALAVEGGVLTAVHVGDSRLYLVRDGLAVQLTRDHTLAAEQVRMGVLSPHRARCDPGRSLLTRCLGPELIVARDRLSRPLRPGDVLILCTDGLHGVLSDELLAEVTLEAPDAEAACRSLIERANALGTPDNVTAAVVRVPGARSARPRRRALRAWLRGMLASRAAPARSSGRGPRSSAEAGSAGPAHGADPRGGRTPGRAHTGRGMQTAISPSER